MAMAVVVAAQTMAQTAPQQMKPQQMKQQASATAAHRRVIVVSLEDRKLALVEDGQVVKVYPVAVGKSSTPSPVGTFTIERRVKNPTYSHDGRVVAPGPNNPVGSTWIALNIPTYGIHGAPDPTAIGKRQSHGCVRLTNWDAVELGKAVKKGAQVAFVGQDKAPGAKA